MEPKSDSIHQLTAKEFLDQAIAEGRLPEVASLGPPEGSNADWDELRSGKSVELSITRDGSLNELDSNRDDTRVAAHKRLSTGSS